MDLLSFYQREKHRLQAVLFDIDGTLMVGGRILPGIAELLRLIRRDGFPFFMVTNDADHSAEEKSAILGRGGLAASPEEIISCGAVLEETVAAEHWTGRAFFVAGRLGEPGFAERAGLEVCRDPQRIGECFGVIQGEGRYDWHDHLQAVMNFFLFHPDRPYIVPNPDNYWPAPGGRIGVGAGGQARFVASLLRSAGVRIAPRFLGKPEAALFRYAMHRLERDFGIAGLRREKILMVGDSLKSDIAGAKRFGMMSGLVMTGITALPLPGDLPETERPDVVFDGMGETAEEDPGAAPESAKKTFSAGRKDCKNAKR